MLKENDVVSFSSKDNANTFCRVFSDLTESLLKKSLAQKINLESKLLKQIWDECEDFVLRNVEVTTVDKILKNLDIANTLGIDQIPATFFKDGAPITVIPFANVINLSINLDTFPPRCKIATIKLLFKKGG